MKKRCLLLALPLLLAVAAPAAAQTGWLFGGEVRGA